MQLLEERKKKRGDGGGNYLGKTEVRQLSGEKKRETVIREKRSKWQLLGVGGGEERQLFGEKEREAVFRGKEKGGSYWLRRKGE